MALIIEHMKDDEGASLCDPEALSALARAGDMEALGRVTRCYGEQLLRLGRARCRTESEAEDAVQDALIAAAEHLDSYEGRGRLEGWLMRMVVNACHRMRRGRKNDPALHDAEAVLTSEGPGPYLEAMRREMSERFTDALESLDPLNRAIVLMAAVEGWTSPEIAEALDLSPGAVRVRLTRARKVLREQLGDVADAI